MGSGRPRRCSMVQYFCRFYFYFDTHIHDFTTWIRDPLHIGPWYPFRGPADAPFWGPRKKWKKCIFCTIEPLLGPLWPQTFFEKTKKKMWPPENLKKQKNIFCSMEPLLGPLWYQKRFQKRKTRCRYNARAAARSYYTFYTLSKTYRKHTKTIHKSIYPTYYSLHFCTPDATACSRLAKATQGAAASQRCLGRRLGGRRRTEEDA